MCNTVYKSENFSYMYIERQDRHAHHRSSNVCQPALVCGLILEASGAQVTEDVPDPLALSAILVIASLAIDKDFGFAFIAETNMAPFTV